MLSSTTDLSREEWADLRPTQKIEDATNGHAYTVVRTEPHHHHTLIVATDETGEEFDLMFRGGFRLLSDPSEVAA